MKHFVWMVAVGSVLALAIPGGHVWAQGADPLDGTWTLNAAKSKFNAGPSIKSQTRKYEINGDEVKQGVELREDLISAQARENEWAERWAHALVSIPDSGDFWCKYNSVMS